MTNPQRRALIRQSYFTFGAILIVWTAAWLLKIQLDDVFPTIDTSAGSFIYWTLAKVLIWVLPAMWLIQRSGRASREVFNLPNYRKWLAWGIGIGLLIALTGFIPSYLAARPLLPSEFSFALLNILIIAPIFEEYLMRGAGSSWII